MSIRAEIKERIRALCAADQLFDLPPELPGVPAIRTIFVSQEVNADIHPPWAENHDRWRHALFRATLDAFTTEQFISVAERPRKKEGYATLSRVAPVKDEVWDFRSIEPKPGIRCFGRFAGKDTFIALNWNYRENLEREADWIPEVERCREEWDRLFNPYPPFRGASLNEYLSGGFHAV